MPIDPTPHGLTVRAMRADDLDAARAIFRLAFGTYLSAPDPATFWADIDYLSHRWRNQPDGALVAEMDGRVVGSNLATRWGTVGWFGPLSVHPDRWGQGIAQALLRRTMDVFDRWKVDHCGLFTFADSPMHVALYRKYGFMPQFLTAVMTKKVGPVLGDRPGYAMLDQIDDLDACLARCRRLTEGIQRGLDLATEIRMIRDHGVGQVLFVEDDRRLRGFAICHCGAGTEAGADSCSVKFGVVQAGPDTASDFARLLRACEDYAHSQGLGHLQVGVNTARREAYLSLCDFGFRSRFHGLAMLRDGRPGYNRPGVFAIDDWR